MSGLKCPLQWDVSSDLLSWIKSLIIWEAICIHKFKISLKETVPSGKTLPAARCRTRELQRCQDSAEGCQGAKRCCADTWKEPLHILERSVCTARLITWPRRGGWDGRANWAGMASPEGCEAQPSFLPVRGTGTGSEHSQVQWGPPGRAEGSQGWGLLQSWLALAVQTAGAKQVNTVLIKIWKKWWN